MRKHHKPTSPPRRAQRLLEWLCPDELLEEIQGDLQELFEERVAEAGEKQAQREYILAVMGYMRPYAFKRNTNYHSKPLYMDMFYNYFLIALRNFSRNKVYSFLNVAGLGSGIAVSLLILLFVQHEKSYDQFHNNADRIFRVSGKVNYAGQEINMDGLSAGVAPTLMEREADVLSFVRFSQEYNHLLVGKSGDTRKSFYEDKWLFADSSFLSVFSFKLLAGNRRTALNQPNTVLITPQMAKKYFGNEDPIGQTLSFYSRPDPMSGSGTEARAFPFTITGIIEPAPSNSSIRYNFIASFQSLASIEKDQYEFNRPAMGNYLTFFLLTCAQKAAKVQQSLNQLVPPVNEHIQQQYSLNKLTDLHLHGPTSGSNEKYIHIFMAVACLILLLALINYMSLTTARATQRAKEVGIRKVVGAARRQLIFQFLGESFLMVLIAFAIACIAMGLLLPLFYKLIEVDIPVSFLLDYQFVFVALLILFICGLLAGSYPALLLSGLLPAAVLKGKFTSERGGVLLRRVFTVFQFSASTTLIICSLVMQNQLDFLRTKDIGLNKQEVVVIPIEPTLSNKYQLLKSELTKQNGVLQVAASTGVPFKPEGTNMVFTQAADNKQISLYFNNIDQNFLEIFDIRWKAKTQAADLFTTGGRKVILNETAVEKLGLKENPLGEFISIGGDKVELVGVVKDFNFMSLQKAIDPLALFPVRDTLSDMMNYGGYLTVRLDPQTDLQEKIAAFGSIYKKYESTRPFEYFFLDEAFNLLYTYQDRLANLAHIFTGFAIVISCLGLFGLAAFTAERRTKEIGIRKVLGANVASIITLLSKDFIRLVLISFLIASPIAWYTMHQWLQNFAYQVHLGIWIFLLAGIAALLIALLTVGIQAIKAALANPVNSLRNE